MYIELGDTYINNKYLAKLKIFIVLSIMLIISGFLVGNVISNIGLIMTLGFLMEYEVYPVRAMIWLIASSVANAISSSNDMLTLEISIIIIGIMIMIIRKPMYPNVKTTKERMKRILNITNDRIKLIELSGLTRFIFGCCVLTSIFVIASSDTFPTSWTLFDKVISIMPVIALIMTVAGSKEAIIIWAISYGMFLVGCCNGIISLIVTDTWTDVEKYYMSYTISYTVMIIGIVIFSKYNQDINEYYDRV